MKLENLVDAIGCIDENKIAYAKNSVVIKKSYKKIIALISVLVMLFAVVVPVFSASFNPVYNLLYYISPSLAQALKPIQLSCEDNGIRMEVISCAVYDDEAAFYISLKDLTNQGRIDGTTDLFDSYRINRAFDSSASCSRLSFDNKAGVATFLITIKQWNGKKIGSDKITFFFTQLLSNKNVFKGELTNEILQNINDVTETQIPSSFRGGGGKDFDFESRYDLKYLMPTKNGIYSAVDGVTVTNVGFIDGKLHIQLYFDNIAMYDNHGYIELIDSNGNKAESISFSFWDDKKEGSYEEIIYEISPEQLSDYKAYGHFVTCDTLIEGRWEVTFSQNSLK